MQNMFLWVSININLCIKNIKKHLAKNWSNLVKRKCSVVRTAHEGSINILLWDWRRVERGAWLTPW